MASVTVAGDPLEKVGLQRVQTITGLGRDREATADLAGLPAASVYLVEDRHDSTHVDPEVSQDFLAHVHLLTPLRVTPIDDVKDEVGVDDLFERAAERRHQVMRKLANEPNGVDEDGRTSEETLAELRIECRKQLVFGSSPGASEAVEEGRLPCVGVAGERHDRHATSPLPMERTRPLDL